MAGQPGAEIFLVNVQNLQTLDISDISAVLTVEVDRRLAARQSRISLRNAISLCRKAQAAFMTYAEIGSPAETIVRVTREVGANQIIMGTPVSEASAVSSSANLGIDVCFSGAA